MTEEQAKTKWCPMVRFHVAQNGFVYDNKPTNECNINGAHDGSDKCIASDCMMWRPTDNEAGPCPPDENRVYKPAGYCGLAGAIK